MSTGTGAGVNGTQGSSSAAASVNQTNGAASSASIVGTSVSTIANANADSDTASSSTNGDSLASASYSETGNPASAQSSANIGDVNDYASTSAFAVADPATGLFAAGAQSTSFFSDSSGNSTASTAVLGFGRLGMQGLTDSEGGFAPSIHVRHDYQTDSNWVIGGELDMTFTPDSTASLTSDFFKFDAGSLGQTVEANTNLLASARLRLGYAMGDYLFYGTGGVAFADFEATTTTAFDIAYGGIAETGSMSETASKNAWGGVVGGGVSAFMAEDTVVSLEGLYYMFDETIGFENGSVKLDDAFSVMVKVSIRPN